MKAGRWSFVLTGDEDDDDVEKERNTASVIRIALLDEMCLHRRWNDGRLLPRVMGNLKEKQGRNQSLELFPEKAGLI
jgi:hypothetical protein